MSSFSSPAFRFLRERSHLLLGGIRLVNGAVALLVPEAAARRLGTDPEANPAPLYPLRTFGVRTVILGGELPSAAPTRASAPCSSGSSFTPPTPQRRRGASAGSYRRASRRS